MTELNFVKKDNTVNKINLPNTIMMPVLYTAIGASIGALGGMFCGFICGVYDDVTCLLDNK